MEDSGLTVDPVDRPQFAFDVKGPYRHPLEALRGEGDLVEDARAVKETAADGDAGKLLPLIPPAQGFDEPTVGDVPAAVQEVEIAVHARRLEPPGDTWGTRELRTPAATLLVFQVLSPSIERQEPPAGISWRRALDIPARASVARHSHAEYRHGPRVFPFDSASTSAREAGHRGAMGTLHICRGMNQGARHA